MGTVMKPPTLDLALLCEAAGIDPERLRDAITDASGAVSVDTLASEFKDVGREMLLNILSAAQKFGALTQVSGKGIPLNSRIWSPTVEKVDALVAGAGAILEAMPHLKARYSRDARFRIGATIPGTLGDMEDFYRYFENTALGMRRLIIEAKAELHIMVPFIDETGFGTLLQAIEESLKRGVKVSFVSRHLAEGQRTRSVLEGIVSISREYGGNLFLYDASLEEDSPVSHAKVISRDGGEEVYIGSANLTASSMERTIEIGVFLQGSGAKPVHDFLSAITVRLVRRWP